MVDWKKKAIRAAAIAALLEADWYYRWAGKYANEKTARTLVATVLADCLKDAYPVERYRETAEAALVCIQRKRSEDLELKYEEGAIKRVMEVLGDDGDQVE